VPSSRRGFEMPPASAEGESPWHCCRRADAQPEVSWATAPCAGAPELRLQVVHCRKVERESVQIMALEAHRVLPHRAAIARAAGRRIAGHRSRQASAGADLRPRRGARNCAPGVERAHRQLKKLLQAAKQFEQRQRCRCCSPGRSQGSSDRGGDRWLDASSSRECQIPAPRAAGVEEKRVIFCRRGPQTVSSRPRFGNLPARRYAHLAFPVTPLRRAHS
jgi:hypothetical protein